MICRQTIAAAVLAIVLILVILLLAGCTAARFTGICAVQPIGVTDSGLTAVAVRCEGTE